MPYPQTIGFTGKGLPGKNTLAYHKNSYIMDVKCFITFGPDASLIKLFNPNLRIFVISLSVGPFRAFQQGLMFAGKVRAYPK